MKLGFDARIIIERPKWEAVRRRMVIKAAKERGPADATEASVVTWRRFVVRNQFFPLNPSEIGGANTRTTAKSGAMRLSTHGAVAVECA